MLSSQLYGWSLKLVHPKIWPISSGTALALLADSKMEWELSIVILQLVIGYWKFPSLYCQP